jgi:hypothetical protein
MVSAKTVETLIIVGGLAAIGGVVAYNALKSQAQTPLPPSPSPPTTGCTSSSQCPSGYICVNGQCVQSKGCTSNSECPPITCARTVLVFLRYSAVLKEHLVTQRQSAVLDIPVSTAYARAVLLETARVHSSGTLCLVRANPLFLLR